MSNMVVRTNVFALNAHRNMKNVGVDQNRASNRLSSGFRINSAADDAAGLAISESMRAQIRGLDQASRNTQDGQALIQTAEGGMQEIQNMLQRIRELTVQASNDTNVLENRRDHITLEVDQLLQEIDEMANRVEFNGMVLLDGSQSGITPQITMLAEFVHRVDQALQLDAAEGSGTWAPAVAGDLTDTFAEAHRIDFIATLFGVTPTVAANAEALAAALDPLFGAEINEAAITGLVQGAAGNAGTTALRNSIVNMLNDAGVRNHAGADIGAGDLNAFFGNAATNAVNTAAIAETSRNIAQGLIELAPGSLFFQVGANSGQGITTRIADMRIFEPSVAAATPVLTGLGGAMGDFIDTWRSTLQSDEGSEITDLIGMVNSGIEYVSVSRAELGAVSNRLDFTGRSLDISSENLSDAESRVRNTDMAREMMNFTMANVLQQAAVSMLSQANQLPNNLLQLLR